MPGWRPRLSLVEQEDAEINRSWCRHVAADCILYLAFYVLLAAGQLATMGCVAVYALASCGPADGLTRCATPGYGNARLVSSISCENLSFFLILISMHTELVLALRRRVFVEIGNVGPELSLTTGHRGGRSIENPLS